MNSKMIGKLIQKDWKLYRPFMLLYALIGVISGLLMITPSSLAYYTGVVMLITVLIGAGAHLSIHSVIIEKKEYQLSFIMAMPIDVLDYTLSKVVGGMMIYLVPWLISVLATSALIIFSDLPNGMLPMLWIGATEVLAATTLLLCIGIMSGSEGITISVMVLFNLLFNLFLFAVVRMPEIGPHIGGEVAVFNQTAIGLLVVEVLVIVIAVAFTAYIKSRRPCFL